MSEEQNIDANAEATEKEEKVVAPRRQPRAARQAPNLKPADAESAPQWATGINLVIVSLISVMLALGLESVGGGISDIMGSRADSARIETLTTARLIESLQNANVVLQNRVIELESRVDQLESENQELRTILRYQVGIEVTPVPRTTVGVTPTAEPISLPTPTENAVELFEEGAPIGEPETGTNDTTNH